MNGPLFWRWGFAWRPFGNRGINIALDRPKLFSERYGHRKVRRIGRVAIEIYPSLQQGHPKK